jgi:hypothetical protein
MPTVQPRRTGRRGGVELSHEIRPGMVTHPGLPGPDEPAGTQSPVRNNGLSLRAGLQRQQQSTTSACERFACPLREGVDSIRIWRVPRFAHRHLQHRAELAGVRVHFRAPDRLQNEVDMGRSPRRVGPLAGVYLHGVCQVRHRRSDIAEQWTELCALVLRQISDMNYVP